MAIRDIDRGYRRIFKQLAEAGLKELTLLVGVRSQDGSEVPEGSDLNLAQIAAVNEFGTKDGHVPERSYLRSTVDANRSKYGQAFADVIGGVIDGRTTMAKGVGRVGARVVADVQQTMRAFDNPPNAPSTIARKGFDNPLIGIGRLRQSIDWEIRQL